MKLRSGLLASIICVAVLPTHGLAQEPVPVTPPVPKIVKLEQAPKTPADIYDTTVDARELVAAALKRASRDNKRVLVMFGGNWCGWCHKLHGVFAADRAVHKKLSDEYEIVMVDIGKWDKHMELAAGFGADLKKHGVPYLTVLAADGSVVTNQDNGSLVKDKGHDPEKVLGFLTTNQAPMADANEVLAAAQSKANASGRRMFIHFGAPWCGWCHRLEDFLAIPEIEAIVAKDFVDVKIDEDRMVDGKQVEEQIRKGRRGGIPWIAITESDLAELANSDAAEGNIGYPVDPHEIAHFMKMLEDTRRTITAEDLATLRRVLDERAAEINEAREKARREAEERKKNAEKKAGTGG